MFDKATGICFESFSIYSSFIFILETVKGQFIFQRLYILMPSISIENVVFRSIIHN